VRPFWRPQKAPLKTSKTAKGSHAAGVKKSAHGLRQGKAAGAEYATSLPKKSGATEPWQRRQGSAPGGGARRTVRIHGADCFLQGRARGDTAPPIGNPEGKKGHWWGSTSWRGMG
jgi:hypothetical protein